MPMKYNKPAVLFSDQIIKLKKRGLKIEDESIAQHYLSNISYYRLRAYTYPYQNNADINHPFVKNVSFKDIITLYDFDRKLRLLVFDAIERIEIALRTQIIYHWSMKYGSHWHLNQNLYKNRSNYIKHLSSLQKEINRSNETFIQHYKSTYTNPTEPPCWMSLEVTSIGLLSLMFQNLRNCPQKKAVTKHFGLLGNTVLENWVHNFCNIRNICAHHGRLWNRRIATPIISPKKTTHQFIKNKNIYPYKLYASLSAMIYILNIISPKSLFKCNLLQLLQSCPPNQLKEMGFPKNWKNEPIWN